MSQISGSVKMRSGLIFWAFLSLLVRFSHSEIVTITNLEMEEDIGDNECWRFTWVGAYDEAEHGDSAVTCDDYIPGDMCFPPIIFTNDSRPGTPDLGELRDACTEIGAPFNITGTARCRCKREASEVCVKYTKFSKNGIPVYYSSFCGSGVNSNNFGDHTEDSGCHRDRKSDIVNDREACFCKSSMCNGIAPFTFNVINILFIALLSSILT